SSPTTVTIQVAAVIDDTDDDGMDDEWETENGLVVGTDDSALDNDGDGASSLEEFLASTDPGDPSSILKIASISSDGGDGFNIQFSSIVGKTYQLQFSPDLRSSFEDLPDASLVATEELSTFNTTLQNPSGGHLRVRVE
ncbi:MAG: hypothetical protein ACR2RV_02110, partial [Verrucomicrobiales bacterium]